MDTIFERLRLERMNLGLSQTAFARLGGASKPSQVRYEKGERSPDGDYFSKLAKHGVDVLFILTGRRENGKFNPNTHVGPADVSKPLAAEVRIGSEEYSHIRLYDVDAAAGNGIIPATEDTSGQIAFTRAWLMRHQIAADLAGLVRVTGDSMVPTVPNGSLALIDFRARTEAEPGPGIYIMRYEDAIVIKRLELPKNREERWAVLVSDNPEYRPVFISDTSAPEFSLIGRVKAILQTL